MAMKGMEKMLEQARKMQEKQNRRLAATTVEATVERESGKIVGRMNGHRTLLSVGVAPELLQTEPPELLEEMVKELVNQLTDKLDKVLEKRFGIVDKMPSLSAGNIFGS